MPFNYNTGQWEPDSASIVNCPGCGSELPSDANFCQKCGRVASTSSPTRSVVSQKHSGFETLGGSLLMVLLFVYLFYHFNPTTSSQSTAHPAADRGQNQPPAESPQQRKQAFLQDVDESISGERIAGNPYKFVGEKVDLHGTVVNVLDDSHFNVTTGDIYSGDYAIILVETNSGNATGLEAKQSVRVIGMVEEPTSGTNAMGGQGKFATIKAEFIE